MIKIYTAKITDFTQADYAKMYSLLDCAIKQKIDSKVNENDQKRSLAGYILFWRGAYELYGKTDIHIKFNQHGKPQCDFCFFNISHSENYVVCALGDKPIGVDIQKVNPIKTRHRYKLFNEKECLYVNQCSELSAQRYTEIFTKKEAALKMLGLSLAKGSAIDTFSTEFSFKTEKIEDFILTVCVQSIQIM